MNRIDKKFKDLKSQGRKALIGYVTAGFPEKGSLRKLVPLLEHAGLNLLEVGVPFSDPIADGPTIQRSSQAALARGVTLSWILDEVKAIRRSSSLPIILMSYCNPVYSMGVETFFRRARACGVDGLIVPDLIPEESSLFSPAVRYGIHLIYLVAPTSPARRIAQVARATRGFLYAVSLTGVTGARNALSAGLPAFLKRVKAASRTPVAVGFGLSTPAQVREASALADGVIVGSALIRKIEESRSHGFAGAARYIQSLRNAIDTKG